jgi:outer membrane protein assembly factor BamB
VAGALELASFNPATGEKFWGFHALARIVIPSPICYGETIYMASWAPGGDVGKRLTLDPWPIALSNWDKNQDGKLARTEIKDDEVQDRFFRMDLNQDKLLEAKEWERHAEVFRRAQNSVFALKPTSSGELQKTDILWQHARGVPYVATPLVDNGRLWMVKDGGIVTQLDASNGKLIFEERLAGLGNYYASPVTSDGKVFFGSENGVVTVLANQTDWKTISSHNFREKIYATPLIDHGRIFIRTDRALYCFQASKD